VASTVLSCNIHQFRAGAGEEKTQHDALKWPKTDIHINRVAYVQAVKHFYRFDIALVDG